MLTRRKSAPLVMAAARQRCGDGAIVVARRLRRELSRYLERFRTRQTLGNVIPRVVGGIIDWEEECVSPPNLPTASVAKVIRGWG